MVDEALPFVSIIMPGRVIRFRNLQADAEKA